MSSVTIAVDLAKNVFEIAVCEFRKIWHHFFRKFWHQGSPSLTV